MVFVVVGVILLLNRRAEAQIGTGILTGKVLDAATSAPLADVVVTATSPALQGEQTVVTDSSGTFRIPTLPPGDYALRFEADGYRPFSRSAIQLRASITLRADAQLLPDTIAAKEVTIVATPPTVDVGTARSGVTINDEFTRRVPIAPPSGKGGAVRSFEQLAEVAPTARSDLYGASIGGTSSPENSYLIDGISVGDPGFGYNGTPLSIDFIKETSIITGGYLPEYGRGGGGVLDVVTKSGSNEFRGSLFGNLMPYQADPRFPPTQDAIANANKLDSARDIGFDLGGPLIKNKLWFYLGADLSRQSYELNRTLSSLRVGPDGKYVYGNNGLIQSDVIPGTKRTYLAEQTSVQYLGKLTYSPSPNDHIELTHRGTPTRSGGDGKFSIDYETGRPNIWANPDDGVQTGPFSAMAFRQIFDAYDTSLKWTHASLNKRLTFDTIVGWHNQHSANLASDGTPITGGGLTATPGFTSARTSPAPHPITDFENLPNPSVCANPVAGGDARCPVAQYTVGGPQVLHDRKYDRYQAREIMTFVTQGLGHHIVKAGLDFEYMTFHNQSRYPGDTALQERPNGTQVNDYRRFGGLTAPDQAYTIGVLDYKTQTLSVGAFLQDSWSIMDKVTLNAGFRYDTQTLYADQGRGLALPNQWSPRIGLIVDPTQRGKAKLFANYAIYYQTIPLNIMARAGSGEPQIRSRRRLSACNPSAPGYPASCDDPANLVTATANGPSDPNQKWVYLSTGRLAVDPDLKPQSTSEVSTGFEYEILKNGRLGVTYIRRWMNNIVEDMSRDEGSTFFLGNPGRGIASDFPEGERTYDAGIIHFTKTFADQWLAQASYTLSYLRGNWEGMFRSQTGQLDPGTNSDFDIRALTVNRSGPLSGDRRHELKLFAARDIQIARHHHLNLGLSYRARSGGPTNFLGRHILYGNGEVFLLPRGSGERLPWVHDVDLHVGYTFLQTKLQTLAATIDVFNLLNLKAVVRRSERYTLREVEPITKNPGSAKDGKRHIDPTRIQSFDGGPYTDADNNREFGAAQEYQPPLTIRIGLKSTF